LHPQVDKHAWQTKTRSAHEPTGSMIPLLCGPCHRQARTNLTGRASP
jgi:hypothetical protein